MLILLVVVLVAGLGAVLASWFMWWATQRSAVWMIAAGMLLTVLVFACVVVVAWLVTRSLYGPQ
jgi:hypothetical protein